MINKISTIGLEELSKHIKDKNLIKVKGLYVSKNLETNEEELIIGINGLKGKIKSEELEIQEEVIKK